MIGISYLFLIEKKIWQQNTLALILNTNMHPHSQTQWVMKANKDEKKVNGNP